jgi:hypothetical protein
VSARLLGVRRFGTAKAAAKRYQQGDFQFAQPRANCWKVPTAGDIQSMLPTLYLLEQREQQQKAGSSSDSESSSSGSSDDGSGSDSSIAGDESRSSRGGSAGPACGGKRQPEFWLAHTKPRKGSTARIILTLRLLSGYDQRHSL